MGSVKSSKFVLRAIAIDRFRQDLSRAVPNGIILCKRILAIRCSGRRGRVELEVELEALPELPLALDLLA